MKKFNAFLLTLFIIIIPQGAALAAESVSNELQITTPGNTATNNPPAVSAITTNISDVDLNTAGIQFYAGTSVAYSASASDANNDPLTWTWYYSVNGGQRISYRSGTGTVQLATYSYAIGTAGQTYRWTLSVSDGKVATESNLTVSIINQITTQPAFDFSLTNGGNKSVTQGSSVSNSITASLVSGMSRSVIFSTTAPPAFTGGTALYSPAFCNPACSTNLTLNTLATTPAGTYTVTVTGTGGGVTKTTQFTLTVNTPVSVPQPPGVVIDHVPASTQTYVGSPSIAILPNGDYVASHDWFQYPEAGNRTAIFSSHDKGLTWQQLTIIDGQWWSTLFVHNGALYIIGTNREYGQIIIRRSSDGGRNWTTPNDANSGLLLANGYYHTAPVPVMIHNGRIWRGAENVSAYRTRDLKAFVMSAPVGSDLLNAANWAKSNFLSSSNTWLGGTFGEWLEGNAVVTPTGEIVDILRVGYPSDNEKAAIVSISADGASATFDSSAGFIDFPGGNKKFTIRYDAASNLYWSLSNYVPPEYRHQQPGFTRNTLALISSPDLRIWSVRSIILQHPDTAKHGFQYADWQFEGNDIVAVSRTAFDDEFGGANSQHDANFLTSHRIANFRSVPPPSTSTGNLVGRIWKDDNGNGAFDAGESYIQDTGASCSLPAFTLGGVSINSVSGPQTFSVKPSLCNPQAYYDSGQIAAGTYTVGITAPAGWQRTTGDVTVNVPAGGKAPDQLFGVKQTATPPVSTKFSINDRVQVTNGPVNVRTCPSTNNTICPSLGTQATNALGTIAPPPSGTNPTSADGYSWWYINYDSGADGWSAEGTATQDWLVKVTTVSTNNSPTVELSGMYHIYSPSVLTVGGVKKMWISGWLTKPGDADRDPSGIYYSSYNGSNWNTPSPINWTNASYQPGVKPGYRINDPSVVAAPSGILYMYFTCISNTAANYLYTETCFATSNDGGLTWTDYGTIIAKGQSGDIFGAAWIPSAIIVGSEIWVYYHTVDNYIFVQKFDLTGRTKLGSPLQINQGFNSISLENPNVAIVGSSFVLVGVKNLSSKDNVYRYVSSDGLNWTADSTLFTPILQAEAGFGIIGLHIEALPMGKYRLYYGYAEPPPLVPTGVDYCSIYPCSHSIRGVDFNATTGNLIGKVWKDDNGNGGFDAGESYIQDTGASCSSPAFTLGGVSINSVSGPQTFSVKPSLCNPQAYYDSGQITAGTYTVGLTAPTGWQRTTPDVTVTVPAGGKATSDPWFGIKQISSTVVSTKFVTGDRVQVTNNPLNVRACPSTSCPQVIIGQMQPNGALGVVATPPSGTNPTNADGFNWWYINYDSGPDGWSAEGSATKGFLEKIPTSSALTITTASLADGIINFSYLGSPVAATGNAYLSGTVGVNWSVVLGSLPPGLSLDYRFGTSNCGGPCAVVISGTPTVAGTYPFTLQLTYGGETTSKQLSIRITDPRGITPKFQIGDKVQVMYLLGTGATAYTCGSPACSVGSTEVPNGTLGTVVDGPSNFLNLSTYWKVDYGSGKIGWSDQFTLVKYGDSQTVFKVVDSKNLIFIVLESMYSPSVLGNQMWLGGWLTAADIGADKMYRSVSSSGAWSIPTPIVWTNAGYPAGVKPGYHANDPSVIQNGATLFMYYTAFPDQYAVPPFKLNEHTVGLATSVDGGNTWTDQGITITATEAGDGQGAWSPSAVIVGNEIWVYYNTGSSDFSKSIDFRQRFSLNGVTKIGSPERLSFNTSSLPLLSNIDVAKQGTGYIMAANTTDLKNVVMYSSSDGLVWTPMPPGNNVFLPGGAIMVLTPHIEVLAPDRFGLYYGYDPGAGSKSILRWEFLNQSSVANQSILTVTSCSTSITSVTQGVTVTWTATASGGSGVYSYSWADINSLGTITSNAQTGAVNAWQKTYNTPGTYGASVIVRSTDGQSASRSCGSVTIQ